MIEWRRRVGWALAVVVILVLFFTVLYRWAMLQFEGVTMSSTDSLQVVIESLTTAGFGGDTDHWNSHAVNLLVVTMNLTGVLLVFLALPLFVVPLFQQALEEAPATSTDLEDHVIICSYTPREDVLRSELDAAGVPYVVVEEDPDTVLELANQGMEAICGDLDREKTFRNANVDDATAIVTDVSDERNVSVILTARELGESVSIVSVAESADAAMYHRYAGANRVIRPRQVLGRSLGRKATLSMTSDLQETVELGDDVELSEVRVREGSDLAGRTLAESGLRDRLRATVIAMWAHGEFVPVPDPNATIDENTILLVAGRHEDIEAVNTLTVAPESAKSDRVVVAGYGVVGRSVVETLDDAGVEYTVVDTTDETADVVGDITDPETRSAAGIGDARAVVLAMDDDTAAMYATVALERLAAGTEVIVRTNDVQNTRKLYRAGAEYALALSTVTGRMLASVLIQGEEVLTPETQFEIIRTNAPGLAGTTLADAAVRERTGATVVAIDRNGEVVANPDPEVPIQGDDVLVVAGSDEAVNMFIETFA